MNTRERTLAALAHKETDRVPIDFGGRHTTFHLEAHQALMRHLNLTGPNPPIRSYHTYLVEPDPQLFNRFGRLTALLFPKSPDSYVFRIDPASNTYVDEWGTKYWMPPGGYYYDLATAPLPDAETEADLHFHRWPDPSDPSRIAGLAQQAEAACADGDKVLMLCSATPGLWEHAWYMFGIERAFMNLAANQPLMEAFTERLLEWQMAYWNMALGALGGCVDLIQLNEDLGSQRGPMMSLTTFRRIYKPRLRRLVENVRKQTNARVYLHSCGSIYRFIPDIIECGIQVLNPVQVNAEAMDSARLKREFGKDLTFWGGGCDPVILANGTPQDVAGEVKRRIRDLAPGGGFVFGPVHNIQANVPPDNIVTLFAAAREFGVYPIQA